MYSTVFSNKVKVSGKNQNKVWRSLPLFNLLEISTCFFIFPYDLCNLITSFPALFLRRSMDRKSHTCGGASVSNITVLFFFIFKRLAFFKNDYLYSIEQQVCVDCRPHSEKRLRTVTYVLY